MVGDFTVGDPARPNDTLLEWTSDFKWGEFKPAPLPERQPGESGKLWTQETLEKILADLNEKKPEKTSETDPPKKPKRPFEDILAKLEFPTRSQPDDVHEKGHHDFKLPKLGGPGLYGSLGIFGDVQPQARFQGNWEDYRLRLKQHNQDIERREQEEYARQAARGGGLAGTLAIGLHHLYGWGPQMQAPPLMAQAEALTVWKNRHKDSLGELLTPPIGEIPPEVKRIQTRLEEMVEKLAGPELKARGIKVNLNLFSGDTLNAFAARNSDEWDAPGGSRVSEDQARYNSAVASLRPVLDPEGSGQPIYELGVTAGALRQLETEDELAFLLGHELAHLLEGHTEKVSRSWLSSQSHEAVADHEAFRMMVRAGYDPAQGLRVLNRLHEGHEPPELGSLLEGLSAGASSHHHEGVRVAMGQLKLEQLRRSDMAAQPTEVVRPIPEWMKLQTEANLDFDPDQKLHRATSALAREFVSGELKADMNALQPKNSEARKELWNAPWEVKTAGRAFKDALAVIETARGDAQKKGDAALLLYCSLASSGWRKGGPPDLSEVAGEVAQFFERQTAAGWTTEGFLKMLAEQTKDSRADSQFAQKVLLSPGFQEAGVLLYESNPEWKKLLDATASLLTTPESKYYKGTPTLTCRGLTDALAVLGGHPPKAKSYQSGGWPKEIPAGSGKLDDVHRRNLLAHLAQLAGTPEWASAEVLKMVVDSQQGAGGGAFQAEVLAAIEPVRQKVAQKQAGDLSQAFLREGAAASLFRSAESHPLTPEQSQTVKENFLKLLQGPTAPEQVDFQSMKVFGQMLADILNHPDTSAADRQRVADYMLGEVSPGGLGSDGGDAALMALQRYLSSQEPSALLAKVQRESSAGLGLTPPPRRSDFELPGLRKGPKRINPTPYLSTIGFNRGLSPKVASGISSSQLARWMDGLKATGKEIDTGTRLFLCDAFIAQQGQMQNLDVWYERFSEVAKGYRFLDGRAELRERFAAHLYPALLEKKPAEVRDWLKKDKVDTVLKTEQSAELLARLAVPNEGRKLDAAALRKDLEGLEKEFELKDKPALRRALHEKIAERAHLQPDQMDVVFPPDTRTISQQAQGVNTEIRGLSAMVAAARTRSPREQLQMVEFLMGRIADAPEFFTELDQLAGSLSSSAGLNLSQIFEETRRYLADADQGVRVAVATSFLAGPSGMLRNQEGRKLLLNHFTAPVREQNRDLATSLATVLLDAHGSQDALAVGYLLAQKGTGGQPLSEGEVLNSLFDAYGVPGIKLKQYLAFTSDFAEFRTHFESSQDSAMPLNYYQAVKLVQHHYGKDWPKSWEVKDIIGSGSVNVALRFYDHDAQEMRVVSLPREQVQTCSEYDFWRMGQFLDLFTKEPENQSKYGFLRGLTEVIRDSVSLEFNRSAAFQMQQSVQPFYDRKVNGWTVKTVQAHGLHGQAIVMEEAKGRTARRVLGDRPEVYRSAMTAMAQVEQDALLGIQTAKDPTPTALHANPDFHDGQVLIDEETKTVTILDFGQAVPIDNTQREYAVDLLTIIGKGYQAEEAVRLLEKRTGARLDQAELEKILASPDQMDVFTKMLGTMAQQGARIPIEVVHWVLGMNRQRSLGEKLDAPIDGKLRRLAAVRMTGGSLKAYNALRIARRSPLQALRGGILGPVGGWLEKLLSEQNLLDILKGKVKPQTLG